MNKDMLRPAFAVRPASAAFLAALVAGLLFFSACSAGRRSAATGSVKERTPDFLMRKMISAQVDAQWLDARAKVNFDDGYVSMGATASILLRRDSVLWIAVRKLGFEVGRAMITTDSVFLIDRLNNEYLARDLTHFTQRYNIPADFQVLQSLVLGNPYFFMTRGLEAQTEERQYHLFGQNGVMESHYWLNGDSFRLSRMAFNDQDKERSVQISFDEYGPGAEDQNFSYLRNLEMTGRQTGKVSIDIRFSEVKFDVPKSIHFEIPERYTRVD